MMSLDRALRRNPPHYGSLVPPVRIGDVARVTDAEIDALSEDAVAYLVELLDDQHPDWRLR